MKFRIITGIILAVVLIGSYVANNRYEAAQEATEDELTAGDITLRPLPQLKATSSPQDAITTRSHAKDLFFPFSSTTVEGLTVTGLQGSGTTCVEVDDDGFLQNASAACGSGSGGASFGQVFEIGTNIFSQADISATSTATHNLTIDATGTSTFAGGLEAWRQISAPYFQATSTTATSTFTGIQWDYSTSIGEGLTLRQIGTPTYKNLQDLQNIFHSAGWVEGGNIADLGGGQISVALGTGLIRNTNIATGTLLFFDWVASSTIDIPADTNRFIGVEYNSGSPRVTSRATFDYNNKTDFILGVVTNENGTVHVENAPFAIGDHPANMIQRTEDTLGIARDNKTGGLILSETGTLNVVVSTGALWDYLTKFTIAAFDSSGADTFDSYYRDGGSGFTKITATSTWDNLKYDDNSGTLATLGNNKYGVQWFYLEIDGDIISVYGTAQYNNLGSADAATAPASLPTRLDEKTVIIGRIIFQESSATASEIQTVFTTVFESTLVTDHGNLAGLGDDDHTQYLRSNAADTATGLITLEGGLTMQAGDTFTFSGDAFTDFTGDATMSIVSGALRVVDLNCTNCIGPTEITDLTLGTDTAGDFVGSVTGGVGIDSTGATSGEDIDHSLTLDLSELTVETTIATGDHIAMNDITDSGSGIITMANFVLSIDGELLLQNLGGAVTDAQVPNNITIDLATLATTLTVSDNESTDEENAILFTAGAAQGGGDLNIESDGTLTYNPSSGLVTATGFVGALTGNADTATALAANPTDCGANTFAISIDAEADLTCTGINNDDWSGSDLTFSNGGTGLSAAASSTMLISDGSAWVAYATSSLGLLGGGDISGDATATGAGVLTISANAIDPAMMANTDFGDWTCSSGTCTLDSGTVDSTAILDNTIQLVDLEATNTEADNDIVTADTGTGGFTFNTPSELSLVETSLTITINGTTNEITLSAGAQDLSANRTWTVSLPDAVYLGTSGQIGRDADNLIDFATDNQIMFRTSATDNRMIIDSSGNIGIATTTDLNNLFNVAGTSTTYGLIVESPNHTGTTTASVGDIGHVGCLQVRDTDDLGWTRIYFLNGNQTTETGTCDPP